MTDMTKEAQGSKKKFLIPLVVLLLCGVALTGAAYAYNSTVSTNGNEITVDAEVLTLADDTGATGAVTVTFGIDLKATTTNGTTKWSLDSTHSDLEDTFVVKLASTTAAKKNVTLSIDTTSVSLPAPISAFSIKMYKEAEHTNEITSIEVTPGTDVTVYVVLTPTINPDAAYTPSADDHKKTFTITASTEDIVHD